MKKLYSLIMVTSGLFAQNAAADVILTPEPNTPYLIEHSSSYYLTANEDALQIMSVGAGKSQEFSIVPVEGTDATYNIQCADGRYVGSDSRWNAVFLDDANDPFAQFTFELGHKDGYILLHNVGRNSNLGTDSNEDGSLVYTDKNGSDVKHLWRLIDADINSTVSEAKTFLEIAKGSEAFPAEAEATLQAAIEKAENATADELAEAAAELRSVFSSMSALYYRLCEAIELRDNTTVGNVVGGVSEETMAALAGAISSAMEAWTYDDSAKFREAVVALDAAIAAFNNSVFTFVATPGQKYYIINVVAGLAMSINETDEVALADYTEAGNQQFELIPVEGKTNYFNFKIADGSGYVARFEKWNTTVLTDPKDALTHIGFYIYDLEEKIYSLGFNQNDFLGLDDVTAGSLVYSNKRMGDGKSHWQVFEVGSSAVDGIMSDNNAISIIAANGIMTVSGVEDNAAVKVYTVDGRLAAAANAANGVCEIALPAGCYAVRVVSGNACAAKLVLIK